MSRIRTLPAAALLAFALCDAPAADGQQPPRTWVTAELQLYTDMGSFEDPASDSRWTFGDNELGIGAGVHHMLGQGLMVGAELGYAGPAYERSDPQTGEVIVRDEARVVTALASGRLAYGGSAELGFYLTGGAGTIAYHLGDLGTWNMDLALRAGTGLEYRFARNRSLFFEWGRIWGYHETEGISGGKATHSMLRLGARGGFGS